jgi:hypothetical protein
MSFIGSNPITTYVSYNDLLPFMSFNITVSNFLFRASKQFNFVKSLSYKSLLKTDRYVYYSLDIAIRSYNTRLKQYRDSIFLKTKPQRITLKRLLANANRLPVHSFIYNVDKVVDDINKFDSFSRTNKYLGRQSKFREKSDSNRINNQKSKLNSDNSLRSIYDENGVVFKAITLDNFFNGRYGISGGLNRFFRKRIGTSLHIRLSSCSIC